MKFCYFSLKTPVKTNLVKKCEKKFLTQALAHVYLLYPSKKMNNMLFEFFNVMSQILWNGPTRTLYTVYTIDYADGLILFFFQLLCQLVAVLCYMNSTETSVHTGMIISNGNPKMPIFWSTSFTNGNRSWYCTAHSNIIQSTFDTSQSSITQYHTLHDDDKWFIGQIFNPVQRLAITRTIMTYCHSYPYESISMRYFFYQNTNIFVQTNASQNFGGFFVLRVLRFPKFLFINFIDKLVFRLNFQNFNFVISQCTFMIIVNLTTASNDY